MTKKQLRDKLSLSNNDSKKGTKPERVLGTSLPSRQVFKLEATENKNLQTAKRRLSTILLEPRVDDLAVEHGKESTTRKSAPPMRDQEKAKVAYTIALSYFVFGICYGVAQYAIPILYASHRTRHYNSSKFHGRYRCSYDLPPPSAQRTLRVCAAC
jgi:hypothetical protein